MVFNEDKYVYPPVSDNAECNADCNAVAIKDCTDDEIKEIEKEYRERLFYAIGMDDHHHISNLYRIIIANKIKKKIQEKLKYDVGNIINIFTDHIDKEEYKVFRYKSEAEEAKFEVYINKNYEIKYIKETHIHDQNIPLE